MGGEFGKCSLFLTDEKDSNYLVNGSKKKVTNYYCSTARSSTLLCGKEGKFYEEKIQ